MTTRSGSRRRRRDPSAPREPLTEEAAWGRLLDWLSGSAHTERQMSDRLRRWRVEPDVALRLHERAIELKLVDDTSYAEAFARELSGKGLWSRAIVEKLRSRGIAPELAQSAAGAVCGGDDGDGAEDERVLELARRRARSLPQDASGARRLASYLVRRGYGHASVRRAVAAVIGADEDE